METLKENCQKTDMEEMIDIKNFKVEKVNEFCHEESNSNVEASDSKIVIDQPPMNYSDESKTNDVPLSSVSNIKQEKDNFQFHCSQCDYETNEKKELINHEKAHLNDFKYFCDECEYKTNTKKDITFHKMKHVNANKFFCDLCSYKTKVQANLDKHKRNHFSNKTFPCDKCDFKTNDRIELKHHLTSHADESFSNKKTIDHEDENNLKAKKMKISQNENNSKQKVEKVSAFKERSNLSEDSSLGGSEMEKLNKNINIKSVQNKTVKKTNVSLKDDSTLPKITMTISLSKSQIRSNGNVIKINKLSPSGLNSKNISVKPIILRRKKIITLKNKATVVVKNKVISKNIHKPLTIDEIDEAFKLQCDNCDYITDKISYLISHEMEHTKEKSFHCLLCSFSTYNRRLYLQHHYDHQAQEG